MVYVGRDDLISSLKRFKSYAKQEVLASELTRNPEATRAMAQARKDEYERLIQIVEDKGVGSAYDEATMTYRELKARLSMYDYDDETAEQQKIQDSSLASELGREQALSNFLHILGGSESEGSAGAAGQGAS